MTNDQYCVDFVTLGKHCFTLHSYRHKLFMLDRHRILVSLEVRIKRSIYVVFAFSATSR